MLRTLIGLIFILLSCSVSAITSTQSGYEVYSDPDGNIYLMAPKQFVLVRKATSVPLSIRPKNGLLKVYQTNAGDWAFVALTENEWNALKLTPGSNQLRDLQFGDMDGDGMVDALLVLNNQQTPYLKLENLTGEATLFAAQGYNLADATRNWHLEDRDGDGIYEIAADNIMTVSRSAVSPMMASLMSEPALAVGQTPGEFRVDESGAANYGIPLNLPAGRAGVKPQLGLSYNSNVGEGYLGVGWSLEGASAIGRCPKNLAIDGVQGNVSFSANDRLCLDGQRLLTASGSTDTAYWTTGASYFKELTDFSIVRAHGSTLQGPKAFTVETKSGEIHYYGDIAYVSGTDTMGKSLPLSLKIAGGATESSTDALFQFSATINTPRQWALKAIRDVKGNYIVFRYANDVTKGEQYLSEVHYTGSGTYAPFAKVVFNYVDNEKPKRGFYAGAPSAFTKRLDSVTVSQDNQQYRFYQLEYDESHATEEKTHLLSVQECTNNSPTKACLPATTFEWTRPAPINSSSEWVCVNNDPSDCWNEVTSDSFAPFKLSPTPSWPVGTTNDDRAYQQMLDFNGDGRSDQLYIENNSWKVRFGENLEIMGSKSTYFGDAITLPSVGITTKEFTRTIDYNGDGQRDLLVANSDTTNWKIISYEDSTTQATTCEPNGDGTKFCETSSDLRVYKLTDVGFPAKGRSKGAWVADYNGDGMEDIVFVENNTLKAYRNRGVTVSGSSTPDTFLGFELVSNLGDLSGISLINEQYGYTHAQSVSSRDSSAIDVNGDGKTDILMRVTFGSCSSPGFDTPNECRYEGGTWETLSEWRVYASNGSMFTAIWTLPYVSGLSNIRPVDLNGDGYTDLMYQSGTTWYYALSNGVTLQNPRTSYLTTTTALSPLTYFLDLNRDGTTDVLVPYNDSNWVIHLSRPTAMPDEINFESRGTLNHDAYASIQFADVNGDGLLDMLTSNDSNGWKLYTNKRTDYHDHVINKITNGWGVSTQIAYSNLQNWELYYRGTSSQRVSSDYLPGSLNYVVVSQVNTEVNTDSTLGVRYQYGGLLLHKKGRGMLGFETLKTTDLQTNVVTETTYHQLWPLTGRPKTTTQMRNDLMMSFASTTWTTQASTLGGTYIFASASTEKAYQVNSDLLTSTQLNQTNSVFAYDGYGNLTSSTATVIDPQNSNNKHETITANTFNSSTVYQRYGRLTAATVTKKLYRNSTTASDTKARQSTFTYNSDLMLQNEVTAPDFAAAKQTSVTNYDSFGNQIQVAITAGTAANGATPGTRTVSTSYTTDGRFVASQTDALGLVTTYKYNGTAASTFASAPTLITSLTTTNPNGLSSTKTFDAFGEGLSEAIKGALTGDNAVGGSVQKAFCNGCETLFPNAFVVVTKTTDTGGESYSYIDKYGREIGTKTRALLGTDYVYTAAQFDSLGRPWKQFEPWRGGISAYYSTATYDELSRITSTQGANYGVTDNVVLGYQSFVIDALGKRTSKTNNYLGQTVSTSDHDYKVLSFTYNAMGDLEKASSANVDRIVNSYDLYGRKTNMVDVDKGSWSYVTNGFGEVISQTNGNAQTTTNTYDNGGRLVRQYDPSGTSCWSYGTTAAAYNVGQLINVKQWPTSQLCTSTITPTYQENYTYTSKSLVGSKSVLVGGNTYTTSTTFDSFGRPYELTYPSYGAIAGIVVRHHYSNGGLFKLTDNANNPYQEFKTLDNRGSVSSVAYGNGTLLTTTAQTDTGWVSNLSLTKGITNLQSVALTFDQVGNIQTRAISFGVGSVANMSETFTYDNLHRVLSRTVNTAANLSGNLTLSESYAYDDNGNLMSKGNVGYYQYNVANKPNRLAGIWQNSNFSGTKHYTFSYDANGNVKNDGKRSFTYTSFDKPSRITQGTNTTDFSYGPARELYKRVDVRAGQTTSTLMIDGIYEQVTLPSGVVEHKYSVGDAVVTKRSNGVNATNYVHKDHLGSTIAVTKADGNILQQFIYDPWGKQYTVYTNTDVMQNFTSEATSKGYTGHEMVNDFDVIHMGGRTYNPVLGRFMQADPHIQFAGNLQSYNRYSYVMNNPMKYTDPSGYFLASIFKSFSRSVLKLIPQSVGNFLISIGSKFCGPWAGVCAAGATYEFSRAHGMSRTGALRAAAAAGVAAYAFEKIGKNFSELGDQNAEAVFWGDSKINDYVNFGGNLLTPGQVARQITAHAAVGGIVSSIGGGKFGHGFFSAGVTKGLGTPISEHFDQGVISGTVTQMVIGGTASVISGDKFINGARTAAFQALYNHYSKDMAEYRKEQIIKQGLAAPPNSPARRAAVQLLFANVKISEIDFNSLKSPEPGPGVCGVYGGYAYCSAISPGLTYGLDGAAVAAYATGAAAPVGLGLTIASGVNGAATTCLCGFAPSSVTSVAPALYRPLSQGKIGVVIAITDTVLTATGN